MMKKEFNETDTWLKSQREPRGIKTEKKHQTFFMYKVNNFNHINITSLATLQMAKSSFIKAFVESTLARL
jgi:hypothetical protein